MLNYNEAIRFLESLPHKKVKPGLKRMEFLLKELGNPHQLLKTVHVGGTNGKGSVTQMLSSIFKTAGFKTGTYTSPHLISYQERIKINDEWITKEEFASLVSKLVPIIEKMEEVPSTFEALTAMAFLYFHDQKVDLAVIEVGLAARFDATNVLKPLLCIITNVERDHLDLMGPGLEEIAWEEAGIVKEKTPLVSGEHKKRPLKVIVEECSLKGAKLFKADVKVKRKSINWEYQELEVGGLGKVKLKLLGEYQADNLAVVVKALEVLKREWNISIDDEAAVKGLEIARWPGRFEVINKKPYIIVDGAHNPHGCRALRRTIRMLSGGMRRWLLFGVLADKEVELMCRILFPEFDEIILTEPKSFRACKVEFLEKLAERMGVEAHKAASVKEGFDWAVERIGRDDFICVAGSLYLVGELLAELSDERKDQRKN